VVAFFYDDIGVLGFLHVKKDSPPASQESNARMHHFFVDDASKDELT
jgi:hypothetical protein